VNGNDLRTLLLMLLLAASYVSTWVAGVNHGYAQGLAGEVRAWSFVSGGR
jgi:hypothetical protein